MIFDNGLIVRILQNARDALCVLHLPSLFERRLIHGFWQRQRLVISSVGVIVYKSISCIFINLDECMSINYELHKGGELFLLVVTAGSGNSVSNNENSVPTAILARCHKRSGSLSSVTKLNHGARCETRRVGGKFHLLLLGWTAVMDRSESERSCSMSGDQCIILVHVRLYGHFERPACLLVRMYRSRHRIVK